MQGLRDRLFGTQSYSAVSAGARARTHALSRGLLVSTRPTLVGVLSPLGVHAPSRRRRQYAGGWTMEGSMRSVMRPHCLAYGSEVSISLSLLQTVIGGKVAPHTAFPVLGARPVPHPTPSPLQTRLVQDARTHAATVNCKMPAHRDSGRDTSSGPRPGHPPCAPTPERPSEHARSQTDTHARGTCASRTRRQPLASLSRFEFAGPLVHYPSRRERLLGVF